jgi:hypothetical protein
MRAGLEQLSFQPVEEPVAEVLPLAVGGPHGAPVVRNPGKAASLPSAPEKIPEERGGVTASGPSWIRTRDQAVMSRQL